jgi:hypothetical protein
MAALDFSLEGMTAEQLRAARDFQQRLGARRAGVNAAAPTLSFPKMVDTTASSAARATAGPAVSTPTETNPAPVQTANAANRLSFGQRAMRVLRGGARALGAAGIGVTGALSAMTTARTPTEEYEKRFGIGPSTLDSPALRFGRDLAIRSAGALVDLGDTVNPFGGAATPRPITQAGGVAAAAPSAAARTPIDAEALMRGTGVPERGTGAFRVGNRPAVTVDSRGNIVEAPVAAPVAVAPAPVVPVLGTEGGIFANAVPFMQQVAQQRGVAAAQTQALRRSTAAAKGAITERETRVKETGSVADRIKALAAVQAAMGAGKKITADMMGNPVVTDVNTGTSVKPQVRQQLTESDVTGMMKKYKLTRAQVLKDAADRGFAAPSGG